jgi:uncharacterized protein (TIGR02996 family)
VNIAGEGTIARVSTLDALIAECAANPDDDAPRLVWADAAGGERGELVMLQCRRGDLPRDRLAACNRRERELLAAHELAWSGLEGLVRCVRFRRGFVDAIEVDADTWLAERERILAIAPLLTSLTLVGVHPTYTTQAGRTEARTRLERIVADPTFARIRAVDLVDHPPWEADYAWGDGAIAVLVATGVAHRLVALGLPSQQTANGLVPLTTGADLALERLWLRGHFGGDSFRTVLRKAPRLVELDARAQILPAAAVAQGARNLEALAMRVGYSELDTIAASMLAIRLERLTLDYGDRDQFSPEEVARLSRLRRLRALDLRSAYLRADALRAFAATPMPALRELRIGWTDEHAELDALVAALGPQLELLDLRSASRRAYPHMAGDVLVDEPRERTLLHAHATERARWYEAPSLDPTGVVREPEWIVAETGHRPGRIWSLGHLGDMRIRIGRMNLCEVPLFEPSIARTHAILMTRNGRREIKDMGSTNGVVVDGARVADVAAVDGARFRLGEVTLRYFCGPGGGARATACARALETVDAVTGLVRQTRPDAARVRIANLAELEALHGPIAIVTVIAALARRFRDAADAAVALTSPELGVIGVHPREAAGELASACMLPVDVDGERIAIRLEVA